MTNSNSNSHSWLIKKKMFSFCDRLKAAYRKMLAHLNQLNFFLIVLVTIKRNIYNYFRRIII